jgi:hypothetical protein
MERRIANPWTWQDALADIVRLNYYTTDVDAFLGAAAVGGKRTRTLPHLPAVGRPA